MIWLIRLIEKEHKAISAKRKELNSRVATTSGNLPIIDVDSWLNMPIVAQQGINTYPYPSATSINQYQEDLTREQLTREQHDAYFKEYLKGLTQTSKEVARLTKETKFMSVSQMLQAEDKSESMIDKIKGVFGRKDDTV